MARSGVRSFPSLTAASASAASAAAAAFLLLSMIHVSVSGETATLPWPEYVQIDSVSYAGSGCPPGSSEYVLSSNMSTLTLIFSNFTASTDGGIQERRKNCQLSVGLTFPLGWSYSVGNITSRGFAALDAGVRGLHRTSFYYSGMPGTAHATLNMTGPFDGNYEVTDTLDAVMYSPCGTFRNLNLNTEVRVDDGVSNGQGIMTVDSTDLRFRLIFTIMWKKCD
ncbi:hypothetical protein CBR_g68778 [Chara braunii]|uniref:DUF4360 domain-containing protein n=1 Tax=Chara braunii TaxID=69332 RepID=A0A388K9Q0_CHABU|nr:hypothetical protein CBR_g68778 [Chara braunii]|eukprot:GBG66792.1 hypothetical protein CBR_g68778 [Chara braunii]